MTTKKMRLQSSICVVHVHIMVDADKKKVEIRIDCDLSLFPIGDLYGFVKIC